MKKGSISFKFLSLISVILSSIFCSSSKYGGNYSPYYDIVCDSAPIELNKRNEIEFYFVNYWNESIRARIKTYYKRVNGTYGLFDTQFYYTYDKFSITKSTLIVSQYIAVFDPLIIKMVAYDTAEKELIAGEFSLKAVDRDDNGNVKVIRPERLTSNTYSGKINYVSFSAQNNEPKYCCDKFIFHKFDSFINGDFYHRFNLNGLWFEYENEVMEHEFFYGDCYFKIMDIPELELYRYLSINIDEEGYRTIPAKYIIRKYDDKSKIYIYLDCQLYVNPKTLEMSSIKLPNFVETQYIYLPKNYYDKCHVLDLKFVGENICKNLYTIEYSFSYQTDTKFLGNGIDSEYVVTTDYSDGYNGYGKEYLLNE